MPSPARKKKSSMRIAAVVLSSILIVRSAPAQAPSLPFFFFNDTATTEIYTLSLHDALPIPGLLLVELPTSLSPEALERFEQREQVAARSEEHTSEPSHITISYAVFCLK